MVVTGAPPLRKIPIDEVPAVMVPSAVARRRRAWATPASGQPRGEAGRDLGAVVRPGRDDPQGGRRPLAGAGVGECLGAIGSLSPLSCVNGFALQVRVATSSVPGSPQPQQRLR